MPSAKIVAQNPGGNFSPLSSFGHASPEAPDMTSEWFPAESKELPRYSAKSAAAAGASFLHKWKTRIEPPENLQLKKETPKTAKIYHSYRNAGETGIPACRL